MCYFGDRRSMWDSSFRGIELPFGGSALVDDECRITSKIDMGTLMHMVRPNPNLRTPHHSTLRAHNKLDMHLGLAIHFGINLSVCRSLASGRRSPQASHQVLPQVGPSRQGAAYNGTSAMGPHKGLPGREQLHSDNQDKYTDAAPYGPDEVYHHDPRGQLDSISIREQVNFCPLYDFRT